MSIRVILFDLDGTLLPMDQDAFAAAYLGSLSKHMSAYGYPQEKLIQTIWQGTRAMVINSGEETNESVFWKSFRWIGINYV